ncbi:diguanylate cyclase DosC [mine drainage metagenome]|uniref:Diguanylate cyclase DosC n=1 Tax=mine drainage metagenome TaxID=410659 RepID=A0A1J5QJW4_9ZZZZ
MEAVDRYRQELELVLEAAGFDLWENDLVDGRVTRRADKVLGELGYGDDDVARCIDGIFSLIHPDDAAGLRAALRRHVDGGAAQYRAEFRLRAKSGAWVWYANYGRIVDRSGAARRLLGVTFNIDAGKRRELELARMNARLAEQNAQLEKLNATLRELATSDSLTGIANRRKLLAVGERELQRALRLGHPLSLLIVDIDDFKEVNDTWGHLNGDRLIRAVAALCAGSVRASVDTAGRIGGEEFAIVLPEIGGGDAHALAERLRGAIKAQPVALDGGTVVCRTVSIGAATLADGCVSFIDLLGCADAALYAAKSAGKDCVRVHAAAPRPRRHDDEGEPLAAD